MQVKIIDHPIVQDRLRLIRSKDTRQEDLDKIVKHAGLFMCYEAMKCLPHEEVKFITEMGVETEGICTNEKVGCMILERCGSAWHGPFVHAFDWGVYSGMLSLVPKWNVGIYREEKTLEAVVYKSECQLDGTEAREYTWFILDPPLATGGTAVAAMDLLADIGVPDENIVFVGLVGSRVGFEKIRQSHPGIFAYVAAIDEVKEGMLVPGFGLLGTRLYGPNKRRNKE